METKVKAIGWDVFRNGVKIDTVFYDASCDAEYVRSGLINHDGYHHSITVKKSQYNVR